MFKNEDQKLERESHGYLLEVGQQGIPVPSWVSQFFDSIQLVLGRPENPQKVQLFIVKT
jgi:hypothetical protein